MAPTYMFKHIVYINVFKFTLAIDQPFSKRSFTKGCILAQPFSKRLFLKGRLQKVVFWPNLFLKGCF